VIPGGNLLSERQISNRNVPLARRLTRTYWVRQRLDRRPSAHRNNHALDYLARWKIRKRLKFPSGVSFLMA
jgi:hypothetical protein